MLPDLGHFLINIQYKPDVTDTLWGVGTEKNMFVHSDHWLFTIESTRRMNGFVIITLNFTNRKKKWGKEFQPSRRWAQIKYIT